MKLKHTLSSLVALTLLFTHARGQNRFDLLITEIFPDPSPSVGLPGYEFIEVQNVSAIAYNLKGLRIGNGSAFSTITSNYFLDPDSIVIICPTNAFNQYNIYGTAIGLPGFPSLGNEEGLIVLESISGDVLHSVRYSVDWYQHPLKNKGGWSLEIIDINSPCAGKMNWQASKDLKGGTPGQTNSIIGIVRDISPPNLARSYPINDTIIIAIFDEGLDINAAGKHLNYQLDGTTAIEARPIPPEYTRVELKFRTHLNEQKVYTLSVSNVSDCAGNRIEKGFCKTGIPSKPDTSGIVINEVLFNPVSAGFDYVEIYNSGNKIYDLKDLSISNETSAHVPLSENPYLIFPGDYFVLTENPEWVMTNYVVKDSTHILHCYLPTLPDDFGKVRVQSRFALIVDEVDYSKSWHFPLLANPEGVSLERINFSQPTNNNSNWISASSTSGFGTPGYQNSQFRTDVLLQGAMHVSPKIFSPDQDGHDDFTVLEYQMNEPGYVATISIFDASGRRVRTLANNSTLSMKGNFRWDGLDDKSRAASMGAYIIVTEIFNLQGKTRRFRNSVVLARKL